MEKQIIDVNVFASRFAGLIDGSSETVYTLAAKTSLTAGTISRYANGIMKPKVPTVYAFADIFKVNPIWLMGYDADKYVNNHTSDKSTEPALPSNLIKLPKFNKRIPILGSIACGQPITAIQEYEDYIDLDKMTDANFALRCKGDSMIDAKIFDGDIVLIREQPIVDNGEIAAVAIDECCESEVTLKRVYIKKDRIVLRPCNLSYDDIEIFGEEMNNVRIVGKAVYTISPIK